MDRSIKVKKLDTDPKGRTIAISDIHADCDSYLALLDKIHYQKNVDRLIIVGDFLEKGIQNLEILHLLMKQAETEDIHLVMGNCDFVCKNALYSYRLNFLKKVLLQRKESILHEMAQAIGITFNEQTNMEVFAQKLRQHFLKELSFVNDLPHVIETNDSLYVHAALQTPEHFGDDFKEVINASFFSEGNTYFPKRVIVGHMPVTEYCHRIADFNPYYNSRMNVYSIDGGNVVKGKIGQLNALIFQDNHVSMDYVSHLPKIKVKHTTRPKNVLPFFITWNKGQVEIRKEKDHQLLVYNSYLNREFWVPKSYLVNGKANEYTNYEMPLAKGEIVELVRIDQKRAQIKKNGRLGWTYIDHLEFL